MMTRRLLQPIVVAMVALAGAATAGQVTSRLRVTVPQPDAELLLDDRIAAGEGTVREIVIPRLDAGKAYEYVLTVRWRPNTYTLIARKKTVLVKGGDEAAADLTQDDPNDRAQIRYVPTPPDIVAEMIKLARIAPDDVVYEPGCGDARITIAAVRAGARKGICVDIDAERVEESKANVKAAGLEGTIDVRLGDALEVHDLSDVTVVLLYMGDDFDRLIRPILWKRLRVGARVVSHRFTMGDWKPDETIVVYDSSADDLPFTLHRWTITQAVKEKN